MKHSKYPEKCKKCGYIFKDGDKFYYDMLNDDPKLDDLCEKCAKNISMMAYGIIEAVKLYMKNIPTKIECLKGAEQICGFVKEDPKQILYLIENESMPAWKRNGKGPWRALNIDLYHWMAFQRNKYLKDTPKYIKEGL